MKKNLHPSYRPVVFRDPSVGFAMLTRSTVTTDRTVEWEDGHTYPVVGVDGSAARPPVSTRRGRVLDTAGRVERFKQRYGKM